MRFEPGFVKELQRDLASIRPDIKARTARSGALPDQRLLSLVCATPQEVLSDVEHVTEATSYERLTWTGENAARAVDAIRAGEVAFIPMAGGAGTRAGGPKAFMRLPKLGMTLMALKVMQSGFTTHEGEVVQAPVWFMTAPSLFERLALHLGGLMPVPTGAVFEQFESYRLRPDNRVSFTEPGVPELYPTGHGDVGPALVESGVLDDNPNVKHCIIVNLDNVMASVDPHVLGHHLETKAHVTCEVVERQPGDGGGGGVPVWHENRPQIVEAFRLPDGFTEGAKYHNTNTMIVSVEALRTPIDWRWHRVRKQVDNRVVVQYERLVQQYTEAFATSYVCVPRDQRYLPIKSEADLLRADEMLNGNRIR